jgi:hypothetical protein
MRESQAKRMVSIIRRILDVTTKPNRAVRPNSAIALPYQSYSCVVALPWCKSRVNFSTRGGPLANGLVRVNEIMALVRHGWQQMVINYTTAESECIRHLPR